MKCVSLIILSIAVFVFNSKAISVGLGVVPTLFSGSYEEAVNDIFSLTKEEE